MDGIERAGCRGGARPTTDAGPLQRPRILPRAQVDLIKDTIMAVRAVGSAGSPLRIAACLQACLCKQALWACNRGLPAGLHRQTPVTTPSKRFPAISSVCEVCEEPPQASAPWRALGARTSFEASACSVEGYCVLRTVKRRKRGPKRQTQRHAREGNSQCVEA